MKKTVILIISALLFINANAQRIRDLTIQSTQDTTAYIVIDKSTFGSYKKMQIATLLSSINNRIALIENIANNNLSYGYLSAGRENTSNTMTYSTDSVWVQFTNSTNNMLSEYYSFKTSINNDTITLDSAGLYVANGIVNLTVKAESILRFRLSDGILNSNTITYKLDGDDDVLPLHFIYNTALPDSKIVIQIWQDGSNDIIIKDVMVTIIRIK